MKAAYIGFGILGKQFKSFIDEFERPDESIYFDDALAAEKVDGAFAFAEYSQDKFKDYSFYVSMGYKNLPLKHKIISELLHKGRKLPAFIHPTVFRSKSSRVGQASFLYPCSNIDSNVIIGDGTVLNNSVVISHDCNIGNCCYISPGVILSGAIQVGDYTFLGSGTVATYQVSIGNNCVAGVGTVITKNIPNNSHIIGNPFKILSHPLNLV